VNNGIDREDIKEAYDLVAELEARGVTLIGSGNQRMASCPFHGPEKRPSFSVKVSEGVWKCHTGCGQGSVIDLIAMFESRHPKDVYRDLAKEMTPSSPVMTPKPPVTSSGPPPNGSKFVAAYSYTDESGNELFQVHRYEPKDFRQGHKDQYGAWVKSMEGVRKVPYHLHLMVPAQEVWITEGEKDVHTLEARGFVATTNPGGSESWLDSYADHFKGKDVVYCGDNDTAKKGNKVAKGEGHLLAVKKSLEGKVKSLRIVHLPEEHNGKKVKDVTDFLAACENADVCGGKLYEMKEEATVLPCGIFVSGESYTASRPGLMRMYEESDKSPVDLGRWLPGLRRHCRPLIPGDLVTVIAATAAGKTAVVQNIMWHMPDIPTCFFQLELSGELLLERFLSIDHGLTGREVESEFRKGNLPPSAREQQMSNNHLNFTETQISVEKIEEFCRRATLKLGRPPRLVVVDYIQLMGGVGDSRYERFSDIAEGLRSMALRLRASVIMTCQCRRKEGDRIEVSLTDGKESGSIENSSSLVLGVWRKESTPDSGVYDTMTVSILKNTRGSVGPDIECNWNPNLRITEKSPIGDE